MNSRSSVADYQPTPEPPINVDGGRRLSFPIAVLLTLLGATISGTMGFAFLSNRLDAAIAGGTQAKADNAETRLLLRESSDRIRALETAQIQIAGLAKDVEWLRRAYDEDRRSRGRAP